MGADHHDECNRTTPHAPRQSIQAGPSGESNPSCGALAGADEAAVLADVFQAVADPARLRLLNLIARHVRGEACVCDLNAALDLPDSVIARHLAVLQDAGLITASRRGRWVYYRIIPAAVASLADTLSPAAPQRDRSRPTHTDLAITVCDAAHEEVATTGARPDIDLDRLDWSIADPARTGEDSAFDRVVTDLTDRISRIAPAVRRAHRTIDRRRSDSGGHDAG